MFFDSYDDVEQVTGTWTGTSRTTGSKYLNTVQDKNCTFLFLQWTTNDKTTESIAIMNYNPHRHNMYNINKSWVSLLKEQCHEIFRVRFFYQTPSPGPNRHAQDRFQIFRILVELFVFVIDSPAMNTPGSRLDLMKKTRVKNLVTLSL